jgi:hypothetical protein
MAGPDVIVTGRGGKRFILHKVRETGPRRWRLSLFCECVETVDEHCERHLVGEFGTLLECEHAMFGTIARSN